MGTAFVVLALLSCIPQTAIGQTIQGPADSSRIQRDITPVLPKQKPSRPSLPQAEKGIDAPAGSEKISFVLKNVHIEGSTAFTPEQIRTAYKDDIGKTINVSRVWEISEAVTNLYRSKGYFLSRAYVPAQDIDGGNVTIRVVEGYVGDLVLDSPDIAKKPLIRRLIQNIQERRPLKADKLEELVLRLNDLPGLNFRSVLESLPGGDEGAVKLTLIPEKKKGQGSASFDNYGSRFLGPNEISLSYQKSFITLQDTTITLSSDIPAEELRYGMIEHLIPVAPDLSLKFSGNYITAFPGSTLKSNNIDSFSTSLGLGFEYKPIRQWLKNLTASLGLFINNSNSDISGSTPLMRDRVRALRGTLTYENSDLWGGYNNFNFIFSRGLDLLGASQQGDLNLSRAQAKPGFMKFEAYLTHQRYIASEYTLTLRTGAQWSSNPLYSGEEFGYGGMSFGRAFDRSEITGDNGVAGAIEVGYMGIPEWKKFTTTPYAFYDYGRVWNKDIGGNTQSAASVGVGVRAFHPSGFSTHLTIAQPLLHSAGQPLYGNGSNPRYLLQLSYGF